MGPADKLVFTECGAGITYNVSVPEQCLELACGLIFDVHGWTMSADIQEANTGIAAAGREEGYIVVQPSAPGSPPSWNSSMYPHVADFMYLAMDVWNVEDRRVHFTGFSQGGVMTFWMRCNHSETIASAAPTAISGQACPGAPRYVPTYYIQGNDDIFVSEAAIANTINSFLVGHAFDEGEVIIGEDQHTLTLHRNEAGDAFYTTIHNDTSPGVIGHCVMGSLDPSGPYGCEQATTLEHGRSIVEFFKLYPKR